MQVILHTLNLTKLPDPGEGYTVIFEDQFNQDGRIPDKTKWELCKRESSAWNKHMSESYDQSYVENGRLCTHGRKKSMANIRPEV